MGIGARIKEARINCGLTQDELSRLVGVTKGAIANYENDISHPKENVLYALIDALAVDANYLFQDCVQIKKAPSLSDEALRVAEAFDSLDAHGKTVIKVVAAEEAKRMSGAAVPARIKVVPLFGSAFAAGTGEPDYENAWEDYEVSADSAADFAIKVCGDSMEPVLHDGQIALGVKRNPGDGEIGAVLVDGSFYVKQICRQGRDLLLRSVNRARSDADLLLRADGDNYVKVFGTII